MSRFARDERAGLLPFAVLLLLTLVVVALPVLSAGYIEGTRWYAQRAADAAALGGAGRQIVRVETDARGIAYCETVAVDPIAGPVAAAQYWKLDTSGQPSLTTRGFAALPGGSTMTVEATVQVPGGGLLLAGQAQIAWLALAEAKVVNSSGLPAC